MSTNKEVGELVGKILFGLLLNFVIAPLLLICGINWVLEGLGLALIPYTLATYFGALVFRMGLKLKVSSND